MKKQLLIKYLNNQCTEEELKEIFNWIKTEALNDEDKNWSFESWKTYQEENDIVADESFTKVFDKIQERIDEKNQEVNIQLRKSLTIKSVVGLMTKAAAILLIPVLILYGYTLNEKRIESKKYAMLGSDSIEVIAPLGSKTIVQLSDGSEVQLNYGSKIKYPYSFSNNKREVKLTGEGFFKVAHNPEKPFIVKAGNLNVKAVGTTFNVLAYPDNDYIETTLVEGKVILEKLTKSGDIKNIGAMIPGLHVNYNLQSGSISSNMGEVEQYISWTNGRLIFKDTPILKVTERLSRIFNVDFEVKDEIKDYVYTVTFKDDPLYQILDLMTIATPISYKTIPRKKLSDGSFSKQKIILEKR